MAFLSFPSPTQLRNLSDPASNQDAATKAYVDGSLSGGTGTIVVANVTATGNISANVLTSNSANLGNAVDANYFVGNGSYLSNISASNITGQVANALVAGTVYTNAQPNITSVGTLTNVTISGNVIAGNIKSDHLLYANGTAYTLASFTNDSGYLKSADLSSYATQTDISNAVANLVNSAPSALDTLQELATALGNDASYSTTITNALANKLSTSAFSSTANTWLSTQTTSNVTEGSNLYYTVTRANSAIDARVTKTFVESLGANANVANTANSVAGANVTGQVANALVAGTVYTAAQPNITSLGNLTSLFVGNSTANVLIDAGDVHSNGNITANKISAHTGYFESDLTVLGNLNAEVGGIIYANSSIIYGNVDTGEGALYVGVPGYTALPNTIAQFGANINNYAQLNFENTSEGNVASTDIVVTPDNGTDTDYYLDVGVAGSGWDGTQENSLGDAVHADDGYVYMQGNTISGNVGNLIVGTSVANTSLKLIAGGTGNSNVRAIVDSTGLNVIGTVTAQNVHFTGSSVDLGDVANVKIGGGTNGYILQTDGAGNIEWVDNLPSTITYNANSVSLTGGVYVSGNIDCLQNFGDYGTGNVYVLTDGTGSAPAWQVDVDFLAVTGFNRVVLNINYTQSSGHTIYVQLYNTTTSTWDSVGSYTGLGSYYGFALEVIDGTPYINGSGKVQLKLYHSNSGNSAHQTSIDYVALELSSQGPQGPRGPTGATGSTGAGVATGGTTGQVLVKNSGTNYDTAWSSDLTSLGNVTLTGNLTSVNANLGNLATANYFTGNGSLLSAITGANVTGNVGNATHAYVADAANSVAGANVSGAVSYATTANSVAGANVSGAVAYATTANSVAGANVSGQVGNALVAGTVYTAAQPNITSVGTLTSLAVTGTVTAGNIKTDNLLYANGTAYTIASFTNDSGYLTSASLSSYATQTDVSNAVANLINSAPSALDTLNELATALGNDASYSTTITNALANKLSTSSFSSTADTWLATKSTTNVSEGTNLYYTVARANTAIDNRVTKAFVESLGANANVANTANAVAGANVSGEVAFANVANNVAGANVSGAVAYATTANSVAGANVTGQVANALVAGTVYTAAQPNITSVGTLTSVTVTGNVTAGNLVTDHIYYANGDAWSTGGAGGGTPGGSNTYIQFNDAGTFGGNASLTFNKTTGTLSSTIFSGSGNALSNIQGANVSGAVAYATTANAVAGANVSGAVAYATTANSVAGANVSGQVANALVAGTVYTNAQPNITSVGTLTGLTVTGNANVTTLNATDVYATGNIVGGYGSGGSITGANLISANYFTGTLTTTSSAQPNITSVGNLTSLTIAANGNISMSGVQSQIAGGNLISANYFTGTLTASSNAQPNITTVGSLINLTVTGNTTTGNVTVSGNAVVNGNLTTTSGANLTIDPDGAANLVVSSTTPVIIGNSLSVTGVVTASSNLIVSGNITTAAGSNADLLLHPDGTGNVVVASVTPVIINNNLSVIGNANIGNLNVGGNILDTTGDLTIATTGGTNGNIILDTDGTGRLVLNGMSWPTSDGTANFVLKTDGAGNLSWTAMVGGGGGGGSGSMSIIDDISTNGSFYPVWANVSSGTLEGAFISTTKFQFNPSSGQLTVQDINTLSDSTLKVNPEPIEDPMTILRQLFGMGFNWADSGKKSYGLMAQMLEKVLPELVGTNAQGQKTVNYIPIIAFLIEAVKRQQDDIDSLKAPKKRKR